MAYLSREAILSADDITTEDVSVPEWGGLVCVRGLSGTERDRIEALVAGNGKKMNLANLRARICAKSIVDEAGQLLFSEADIAALGAKSAAALERVFSVAQRLSGLTDEDIDDLTGE